MIDKEQIGTGAALLIITLIGLDFLDIPYVPAKVGPSGYWCILVAFMAILPVVWLISAFCRRFPEQNLLEAAPRVIGKVPALLGNLLFLGVFLIWLVFAIRDSADLVLIYMLNRTPLWVVLTVFLAGVGYVAAGGLRVVAYLAAFVLLPSVILRVLIELLAFQKFSPTHLMPIFSEPVSEYCTGGLALVGYFAPIITFFLIHPQLQKPKSINKVVFGSAALVLIIFILALTGTVGLFGATYTQKFAWPELNAANHVSIPYLSVEQVGLLLLIVWLTTFFVSYAFYLYLVVQGITWQFPLLKAKATLIAILGFIGVSAYLFPNTYLVHSWFALIRQWAVLPWIIYPAFVFGVAVLRGVGKR